MSTFHLGSHSLVVDDYISRTSPPIDCRVVSILLYAFYVQVKHFRTHQMHYVGALLATPKCDC